MKLIYGDSAARKVSERIAEHVADTTTLAAIPAARRVNGMLAAVDADMSIWVYDAASVIAASATIIAPTDNVGRWRHLASAATV